MDDLVNGTAIADLFRVGGAGAVLAYSILWLLRRGDALQRDNIADLRRQRDEWRERAETAETAERELRREVGRLRAAIINRKTIEEVDDER